MDVVEKLAVQSDSDSGGFGLFGKGYEGIEERLDWWPQRDMLEKIVERGHYQALGFTDLQIREDAGEGSDNRASLEMAEINAAVGRTIKKRMKKEAVRRDAAMPDTRFVMWREIWSAIDAAGVQDGEPVASIHCDFPLDLEGEPELKIDRDEFGIVRITFGAKTE